MILAQKYIANAVDHGTSSFVGVVLVSLSDSEHSGQNSNLDLRFNEKSQPLFGDILAFISAIFYALYVVFLKVKIGIESRIDMRLFLGFVGLFNLLTCWPVGVLLHWFRMERFELPNTSVQWYALLTNVSPISVGDQSKN
jgi:solute carrier family 35 protein F5